MARPPHSNEKDGFKRAGRFKVRRHTLVPKFLLMKLTSFQKASNMNFGLALSCRMEELIEELQAKEKADPHFGEDEELPLEERALRIAVEETQGQAWASNARSLRIGEIILLVDSDTQVPDDCFRDAARELAECPEVAIIQHESDVLQVAHHWFEVSVSVDDVGWKHERNQQNGMAYFTRRINHSISAASANGEVAPFVGHNA